jgi:hypothetical protein
VHFHAARKPAEFRHSAGLDLQNLKSGEFGAFGNGCQVDISPSGKWKNGSESSAPE